MENPFNTKIRMQAILRVGITLIAIVLIQHFYFTSPSEDEVMMEAAIKFNKNCPFMADSVTRTDNVAVLPGKIFQFNETIMNLDTTSIGLDEIRKNLEPQLINNVKTNPGLKMFRDKKITLIYSFKDIDGNFRFKVSVGPEQYDN